MNISSIAHFVRWSIIYFCAQVLMDIVIHVLNSHSQSIINPWAVDIQELKMAANSEM